MKNLLKRFAGFLPAITILAIGPALAQAGVFSVVSYPVRHPVKLAKHAVAVVTYPVRHPIKTVK